MLRSGLRRIASLAAAPARAVLRQVVARAAPDIVERRAGALADEAVALRDEIDHLEARIEEVLVALEATAEALAGAELRK